MLTRTTLTFTNQTVVQSEILTWCWRYRESWRDINVITFPPAKQKTKQGSPNLHIYIVWTMNVCTTFSGKLYPVNVESITWQAQTIILLISHVAAYSYVWHAAFASNVNFYPHSFSYTITNEINNRFFCPVCCLYSMFHPPTGNLSHLCSPEHVGYSGDIREYETPVMPQLCCLPAKEWSHATSSSLKQCCVITMQGAVLVAASCFR